jgi:hypothetical protein
MYAVAYKAVCYQCSFEGQQGTTRCPVCHFPVILEPENTPPGGFSLPDILARSTVRDGGPPLPGVDAGKRKAQLNAEARRERAQARDRKLIAASAREHTRKTLPFQVPMPPSGQAVEPSTERRGWIALRYGVLCATAVAAGVLLAALQSG